MSWQAYAQRRPDHVVQNAVLTPTLYAIRQEWAREIVRARPGWLRSCTVPLVAFLTKHATGLLCWLAAGGFLAFELSPWVNPLVLLATPALAFFGVISALYVSNRQERRREQSAEQSRLRQSSDGAARLSLDERAQLDRQTDVIFERQKSEIERVTQEAARLAELTRTQNALLSTQNVILDNMGRQAALAVKFNQELNTGLHRAKTKLTPRVLLVEDYDDARELLLASFRHSPFRASLAFSAEDALRLYHEAIEHGEPFKLLVLDYSMPGGSGMELLKSIRDGGDQIVDVIFYTGYPDHVKEEDRAAHRVLKVLTKPLTSDELEREIVAALGG
jgi:CheY-like chemotaxis protein